MPAVPYLVAGKVYQSDEVTASASNVLLLVHESSGETLTVTTDANGNYSFDLANLTNYSDGEYFKIIATGSTSTGQDLRLRVISRNVAQISEIKVKYKTS